MYEARYAVELLAKKDRAVAVVIRMTLGKVLSAFTCWKEVVEKDKHDEQLLRKFVKRMYFRGVVKAIDCWKEVVHERKFLRRFMQRMLGGRDINMKSAGFRTWVDSVRGYKDGEEKVVIVQMENFLKQKNEQLEDLTEELSFLRNQIEGLQSEKMASDLKNMKKFIEVWQNKGLHKTFNAWKVWLNEINNTSKILARSVLKWQNNLVEKVFVTWRNWHRLEMKEKKNRRMKQEKEGEWQNFLRRRGEKGEGGDENNSRRINTSSPFGGGRGDDGGDLRLISPQSIRTMAESDLRESLRMRGLPTNGSKAAMIARLTACQDFLSPRTVGITRKMRGGEGVSDNISSSISMFANGLVEKRRSGDDESSALRRSHLH